MNRLNKKKEIGTRLKYFNIDLRLSSRQLHYLHKYILMFLNRLFLLRNMCQINYLVHIEYWLFNKVPC